MHLISVDTRKIIWFCLPPLIRLRMRQLHRLMAGMLKRSYPLPEIFKSLAQAFPHFARLMPRAFRHTNEGMLLSEAIKKSGLPAPSIVDTMIETGEKHNILPQALELACKLDDPIQFKKERTRASQFISYISAVGISIIMILILLFIEIVPVLEEMFSSTGGQLPEMTLFVIDCANWVQNHIIIVILFFFIIFAMFVVSPYWICRHERLCRTIEVIPIAGPVLYYSRWWKALYGTGVLIQAGMNIDGSIDAMGKGRNMPILSVASLRIASRLERGFEPVEALKDEKIFPKRLGWVLSIAADNSDISYALKNMGSIYREIAVTRMNRIISFSYAISIMLFVLLGGFILFSMYLPMFTFGELFI